MLEDVLTIANLHVAKSNQNMLTSLWSFGLPLKQWLFLWRCLLGVLQTSNAIDSHVVPCTMWWTIRNSLVLIMDLLTYYNICTEIKCISFSQMSRLKVWVALLLF